MPSFHLNISYTFNPPPLKWNQTKAKIKVFLLLYSKELTKECTLNKFYEHLDKAQIVPVSSSRRNVQLCPCAYTYIVHQSIYQNIINFYLIEQKLHNLLITKFIYKVTFFIQISHNNTINVTNVQNDLGKLTSVRGKKMTSNLMKIMNKVNTCKIHFPICTHWNQWWRFTYATCLHLKKAV